MSRYLSTQWKLVCSLLLLPILSSCTDNEADRLVRSRCSARLQDAAIAISDVARRRPDASMADIISEAVRIDACPVSNTETKSTFHFVLDKAMWLGKKEDDGVFFGAGEKAIIAYTAATVPSGREWYLVLTGLGTRSLRRSEFDPGTLGRTISFDARGNPIMDDRPREPNR